MKSRFFRTISVVLVFSQVVFGQSPTQPRFERVEKGLLPAVLIKGDSAWTIQERMKHYKVPGVSIAVINNFKIEWAKAYGVKLKFTEGSSEAPRMSKDAMVPYEQLRAGKLAEAIEGYKKIKNEKPLNAAVQEARLNDLGYSLLQDKRVAEAIAVFKVNVELYPQSSNVYDSLGEAYLANGDKELTAINYKKSLELDPHNQNAVNVLKKLQR